MLFVAPTAVLLRRSRPVGAAPSGSPGGLKRGRRGKKKKSSRLFQTTRKRLSLLSWVIICKCRGLCHSLQVGIFFFFFFGCNKGRCKIITSLNSSIRIADGQDGVSAAHASVYVRASNSGAAACKMMDGWAYELLRRLSLLIPFAVASWPSPVLSSRTSLCPRLFGRLLFAFVLGRRSELKARMPSIECTVPPCPLFASVTQIELECQSVKVPWSLNAQVDPFFCAALEGWLAGWTSQEAWEIPVQ